MTKSMLLKPRISEKTYSLSEERRVYTFEVPTDANKLAVKSAVEAQFGVSVTSVNITNLKGKTKLSYRKRSRPVAGRRSDIKKAYVTLKEGDSIAIFATEDQADKPGKKEKK